MDRNSQNGASAYICMNISNTLEEDSSHIYSTGIIEGQVEQQTHNNPSSSTCEQTSRRLYERGLEWDGTPGLDDDDNSVLNFWTAPVEAQNILGHVRSATSAHQENHSLSGEMQCIVEPFHESLDQEAPNISNTDRNLSIEPFYDKNWTFNQETFDLLKTGDAGHNTLIHAGPSERAPRASENDIRQDEEPSYSEAEQNQGHSFTGRHSGPGRRFLIQKFLTASDTGTEIPGILLPKEKTSKGLPHPGLEGLVIRMEDGEEDRRTWTMRFTQGRQGYKLKETAGYIRHHDLKGKDLLQIILKKPDVGDELHGDRYILKFKRCLPEWESLFRDTHTGGRIWKLIFQKVLIASDVKVGPRSLGTIGLGKEEAENSFPTIPERGDAVDMTLYDWHVERTWMAKFKRSSHAKCNVYRLQNMAEFLRTYFVEEGDLFYILKSDQPDVRYAVHVSKPLLP